MVVGGQYPRVNAFGLGVLKKYPELLPLFTILSFPAALAVWFTGYSLYQKTDVTVVKQAKLPPWERVVPEERQKLFTIHQKYAKIPELEALKKEIGSYNPRE